MNEIYLVIPRWFYPNNLGDSVHSTFAATVLKNKYPDSKLIVVTYGQLLDVMHEHPSVDQVAMPTKDFARTYEFWRKQALTGKPDLPENIFVVFAEWHPEVWNYWNKNFEFLSHHPTANILVVNSLLQMGRMEYLYNGTNLSPVINVEKPEREEKSLGIVIADKLAGRPEPHPGCDGKGLRFNGDSGESWRKFVKRIKDIDSSIHVIEYAHKNYGIGDEHIPHIKDWRELAKECARPQVVVTSDGGMRHVFSSQKTPIVYLSAQTINKPYHYTDDNTTVYWSLFNKCLSQCDDTIRELKGWEGLRACCDNTCEKVDPIALANNVYRDFFNEQ